MDQSSRIAELDRFKSGEVNILVASDVAARGLDVKGVSHVFNFDTPWHPDDYVHRIGRTGRAGAKGRAFTLVTPEDAEAIANVEKLTNTVIPTYELGSGSGASQGDERPAERPKRESRERKPDKPRRESREREAEEAPKPEPVEARVPAPRKEAPPRREREPAPRRGREPMPEETGDSGEWNGPVPGFLNLSAL
jgi:superfamily II DNA/RNA helicase